MNNVKPTLQELRKQAESNSPEAWFQLAQAHMGLQEPQEAHGWFRRAAEAGHVPSQVDLARQLLHGNGVVADPGQAAFWLRRAEPSDHPVAAYLLALLSLSGVVVPYDNRINDRLTKAVNAGFAPALRAAAIHFGRKPDPADQQRCLQLLQHGMQRGDWVSALLLAERLQRGEGCKPNLKAARAILDKLDQNGIAPLPALTVAAVNRIEGPANTLSIDDTLQSPTAVSLSEKPKVWVMDGLLSADECRLLIALARPVLQPSRAIDLETGKPIPLSLRTMSDVTFDPVAEDLSLRMVQQRMATAAGVEFFRAESLRVMRQESGDEVLPPVGDYLPPGSGHPGSHIAGNRAHTICVYLNQPEAGGEIQFPAAGFNVKTQTARAVIFDNLQADGSPDLDSQHSALPVKRGEKWLATLWLREGRYRNF